MNVKRVGAELVLAPVIVGIIFWFSSFVLSSYSAFGDINNLKDDLKEIKKDTKEIKTKQDHILDLIIEGKLK